jgi:hypothetical protein
MCELEQRAPNEPLGDQVLPAAIEHPRDARTQDAVARTGLSKEDDRLWKELGLG